MAVVMLVVARIAAAWLERLPYGGVFGELSFLACAILFMRDRRALLPKKVTLKETLLCVPVGAACFAVGFLLAFGVSILFPHESVVYDAPAWYLVLAAAVLPAVCEEALFRGAFDASLPDSKWSPVLSAMCFAAFHLDVYRLPQLLLTGFVLSYTMRKTKNLAYPMMIHFVNNIISVMLSI